MKSVFLSWDEPACTAVAKRILGMEDSSSRLVLVPTKEAARQLKQEIALVSKRNAAFTPKLIPAGTFLEPEEGSPVATGMDELYAWFRVLKSTSNGQYPNLFPQGLRDEPDFLLDIAEQMASLRNVLAREGVSFDQIAEKSEENERWCELDDLNRRFAGKINMSGLKDSASALCQEAAHPHLAAALQGIPGGGIILACVPEIPRPNRKALIAAEEMGVPVEYWIHAPSDLAEQFDAWGCPLPSFWSTCPIALDDNQISVAGNPSFLAQAICKTIAEKGKESSLALGVCDQRMATPIETELRKYGWGLYNPNGRPFSGTGLITILRSLEESLNKPHLAEPLINLLRSPILASSLGISQHCEICSTLDHISETWIPESAAYMANILISKEMERQRQSETNTASKLACIESECKALAWAWREVAHWRDSFRKDAQMGATLNSWLKGLQHSEDVELLIEATEELTQIEKQGKSPLSPSDSIRLLIRRLQRTSVNRSRTEEDTLDALGWMELSFCPEPHLIITGLSEGIVPEGQFGDQFLPESLRSGLGITSMKDKTARDSFLLLSLIESRKNAGSVSIALSKTTPQNEPLIPSSLLMRCSDDKLALRVNHLFSKKNTATTPIAYDRGKWHISPASGWGCKTDKVKDLIPGFSNPWQEGGKAFSPSTLKRFLSCPLRFWIQTALDLNDSNALHKDRRNMLPAESGTLMHKVLEIFAKKYPIYDSCLIEDNLKRDISGILSAEFETMFGDQTLLPFHIQKASMEQRLAEYASLHLAELREGWECIEFERQVKDWTLGDFPMNFRIDRIDRHKDGQIRVVDYKTGKAEPCEKKHLKLLSEEAIEKLSRFSPHLSPFPALFNRKYRPHRWTDLQLPIYALWASESFRTEASASYYAIPSNKRDIRRFDWENLHTFPEDSELSTIESAKTWAIASMNLLRNGLCTTSSEEMGWGEPNYDLFADLKVEESIQHVFGIS